MSASPNFIGDDVGRYVDDGFVSATTSSEPIESESDDLSTHAWPAPPTPPAFRGLAGDVVRVIAPHTEAASVAILTQFLVHFGSIVGRSPHYVTDGARQRMNENLIFIGPSGSGRKGTAESQGRGVACRVDPFWDKECVGSGLSSGEGLIHRLRDPLGDDPGVADKRLLVVESEFSSVLRVMRREGNTLSTIVRQAWDGGVLQTMTKSSPSRATDAHISIVAHITPDELRRLLDNVDAANGFLNRFMLVAVKRSNYLPEGGTPSDTDLDTVARVIRDVAERARNVGRMMRDTAAKELWAEVYPDLSDRPGGLLGIATSRAAPHVVRLSCLYALLDGFCVVQREHLESALALWRYVEDSTRFFLGESLGDAVADAILDALRAAPDGLTRTEISRLGHGHWKADDIDAALKRLANDGLAMPAKEETKGRRAERWIAAKYEKKEKEGGAR